MKILLIDLQEELVNAWQKTFSNIPEINIHHGSVFDFQADALISPANSYGFMNGGIDFAISKHLGWHIEKKLQKIIREKHFGELLIGNAEIVETDHLDFPFLISAPTMRTPMTITRTPNVYLAMRAILLLVKESSFADGTPIHQKVNSLVIPGLGTGVGQMPPLVAARQMRIAWEDVMQEKYKTLEGWEEMRANYAYFYTCDLRDLKFGLD